MATKPRKIVTNEGVSPEVRDIKDNPAIVKKELRQVLRDALDHLGGTAWLVSFIRRDDQNARAFLQVLGRTLPMELAGKDGAAVTVIIQSADGSQQRLEDVNRSAEPLTVEGESSRLLNS